MWSRPAGLSGFPSRRRRQQLSLLLCTALLAGCISLEPAPDTRLTDIASIEAFAGTYRNRALQADPDSHASLNFRLSYHIWPEEEDGLHDRIDALKVTVLSLQRLRLEALADGRILKNTELDTRKGGGIRDGRLLLSRNGAVAGFKPGEPILGRVSRRDLIGLNGMGSLVLQSRDTAWGLVYLLVPVLITVRTELVFERVLEQGPEILFRDRF